MLPVFFMVSIEQFKTMRLLRYNAQKSLYFLINLKLVFVEISFIYNALFFFY